MTAGMDILSGEVSDIKEYMFSGLSGAITGAAFSGIGLAGQAIGKTIKCVSTLGKVISVTSKVSGGISLAMDGFDVVSFGLGVIDPDNAVTTLNQQLHSSDLYNYTQLGVNALALFTGSASSTMKCFVAGTPILTPLGLVVIEDIKTGDKVISTCTDTFVVAEKNILQTYIRETNELIHLTINSELIKMYRPPKVRPKNLTK